VSRASHTGARRLLRDPNPLVYLPPYTPDFNPIEEAFSKIKRLIPKAEARSREALVEAIGTVISALSAQDARGFFEHCGYRATVQLCCLLL
jgi:transposase